MAETPSVDEVRGALEKQISDLKKEVSALSKSFASRASDKLSSARDYAEDAYDEANDRAEGTVRQVRHQAQAVAGAIRDNPGTAATVLSSAGIAGFLLGMVVGNLMASNSRRW
jgi:ElaB/YqjD/DUF883 family membrane-anchored ribosome-binding protein